MTTTQTHTMEAATIPSERDQILDALERWISQRPGLEFGNYGDHASYNAEARSIRKDGAQARELLRAVRWRSGIDADALKEAFRRAFSGRLSWVPAGVTHVHSPAHVSTSPYGRLDYCTGQYWPTEYRRAACAVLASALWAYVRENLPEGTPEPGNVLRANFRKEYGKAIAARWFD